MNRYKFKDGRRLRCGYTTGTCAAAAAAAAVRLLLKGESVRQVFVELPEGGEAEIAVEFVRMEENVKYAEAGRESGGISAASRGLSECWDGDVAGMPPVSVSAGVRKDAGDDADVTDGMLICVTVCPEGAGERMDYSSAGEEGAGKDFGERVVISAGRGVGRVTKPGLDQPVGEAAVNTVPRRMICREVEKVCREAGYDGRISAEISVPGGEEAAAKTFNPLLGVEGGISILGTSGIVEPMSDRAVVETIRTEVRSKAALCRQRGQSVCLAAVPGNYGMKFIRETLGLQEESAVKCSNFIGETLDACWEYGIEGILLAGNAGKLIKLAAGVMNTHSSEADARMETIVSCSLEAGASLETLRRTAECVTTEAAFSLLKKEGLAQAVLDIAAERAAVHMARRVKNQVTAGIIIFSAESGLTAWGGEAEAILEKIRIQERNR